jgi:hypothetical protein
MGPVPGSRCAARVLAFADGRSESEVRIVRRRDGGLVGRCDFGWEDHGTVGEFDGRVKYGRLLSPGQSAGDAVYAEKLREDELRDGGWQVVRWTWQELDRPALIGDRLRRAFARGRRLR